MVDPGRLKIYENGQWRYVGYGPASSVATNISDVTIDANKDWNAKNITNVGTVDGVDVSAFKSDYDAKVNQAVLNTSSPTFYTPMTQTVAIGKMTASANLKASNDTEKSTTATSYTKVKSMEIYAHLRGVIRVTFDLKCSNSGDNAYAKVYKNGVAVGTEKKTTDFYTTYLSQSDDITLSLEPGDTLEIWAYRTTTYSSTAYVRNMRLNYDITPATAVAVGNDP